jgi:hypothetical protein
MTDTTGFPASGGGGGSRKLLLAAVAAVLSIVVIVLAVVYITGRNHNVSVLRAGLGKRHPKRLSTTPRPTPIRKEAAQDARAASDAAPRRPKRMRTARWRRPSLATLGH